jgi:dihydroneopterin aldolase
LNKPLAYELQDYAKQIVIGCAKEEHDAGPQEVVFNVTALLPCSAERFVENWLPEFDYLALTAAVDGACDAIDKRILQEPLALDVAGRVFLSSPLVETVEVLTRKTQRYQGAKSIGFRLTLTRIQWSELKFRVTTIENTPPLAV